MQRRPSGSTDEEDSKESSVPVAGNASSPLHLTPDHHPGLLNHAWKAFRTTESFDLTRTNESLDRRKPEKPLLPSQTLIAEPEAYEETEKLISGSSDDMADHIAVKGTKEPREWKRSRIRSPWRASWLAVLATALSVVLMVAILHSFNTRQLDPKGCQRPLMIPAYVRLSDFDTEHTRFASKYSLYLYREQRIDEDPMVKGVPVLFITGNAGSYKQVRSLAAEAARYFHESVQHDTEALQAGARPLDFFTADFNEDITAFHGQTLLDQAEYLNEAVAYILALYHNPHRSRRDHDLPDPTSVILVGHSMGGIVARTMLIMPNYQANSINTIITMSAPHARPPVAFDAEIVNTYQRINDYWREAYSQKWANDNPLWHVTLISIAGGGLDTIVPCDYTSLTSLVPETHGFTVYTSSIPRVWTGSDHLSIIWCDQLRKVIVRSLIEAIDVRRPSQTKPRAERMRIFQRWYLTGMEPVAEKSLPQKEPTTLLTLEDKSNSIMAAGKRLILRDFGHSGQTSAHLLPIPQEPEQGGTRFTLLSDQPLDVPDGAGKLEVLFCSVFPLQAGHSTALLSTLDFSGNNPGSTRLACKNAASDVIQLPASTRTSKYPFDSTMPFSYLQYTLENLSEHQFVAVIDKSNTPSDGWAVAEFSSISAATIQPAIGLMSLLLFGLDIGLPADRPLVTELQVPAVHSSLLAYKLTLSPQACGESNPELFTPLLRQYIREPHESKFFVNVRSANINIHGIAPFMPPPLRTSGMLDGLNLQLWADPECHSSVTLTLRIDALGSAGKLYMRYRTAFLAFPILVVALVLRKQFAVHDSTGIFLTFFDALHACLRSSLPLLLAAMSALTLSLAHSRSSTPGLTAGGGDETDWRRNSTTTFINYTPNDLLLGSQDPFFWFLVPLCGLVSVGMCVLLNYAMLGMIGLLAFVYGLVIQSPRWKRTMDDRKRSFPPAAFASASPRRRILTTCLLLLMVSTIIPYQFAYMVAVLVQIATSIRAFRSSQDLRTTAASNFASYTLSILLLYLLILPLNAPILVVWIRNLSVHWLTPFSSHHNVLSIFPLLLLVESLTSGTMIPRLTSPWRHVLPTLLFALAAYAAIWGVTYAYRLHVAGQWLAAWLVGIHFCGAGRGRMNWKDLLGMLGGMEEEEEEREGGRKRT